MDFCGTVEITPFFFLRYFWKFKVANIYWLPTKRQTLHWHQGSNHKQDNKADYHLPSWDVRFRGRNRPARKGIVTFLFLFFIFERSFQLKLWVYLQGYFLIKPERDIFWLNNSIFSKQMLKKISKQILPSTFWEEDTKFALENHSVSPVFFFFFSCGSGGPPRGLQKSYRAQGNAPRLHGRPGAPAESCILRPQWLACA